MYDVALSFAGEDRPYVHQVAAELTRRGVNVFYDQYAETEMWGRNLIDHFNEVFSKQAKFCVIFISKAYAAKSWPNAERQVAQARSLLERREYILPVRIDDTPLQGMPETIHYVDARKAPVDKICDMIQSKLGMLSPSNLQQKSSAPLPPIADVLVCNEGPHSIQGPLDLPLDIRAGDTLSGTIRERDRDQFSYAIVDEENLVKWLSHVHKTYSPVFSGDDDGAYFVKPWIVPHNGPWYLILKYDGISSRIIKVGLRRQAR